MVGKTGELGGELILLLYTIGNESVVVEIQSLQNLTKT